MVKKSNEQAESKEQRRVLPYDPWITFKKSATAALRGALALAGGALLTFLTTEGNLKLLLESFGVEGTVTLMLLVPTLLAVIVGAQNWWKTRFGVYAERREDMRKGALGPASQGPKRHIGPPPDFDLE